MTGDSRENISDSIIEATDYVIELEPLTAEQILLVIHQRLVFCNIDYEGEKVLDAISELGMGDIKEVIQVLKRTLMLMDAELKEFLTVELVEKAERLFCNHVSSIPAPNSK
jgi:phosphoribosylformylglycinamidine (FGAM) synthase PurS component